MKNDVIIIGGGAAGLCAAVALKKRNRNLSVRLLETMPRVGKKLAATGNGRCNITNRNIDISRYHGKHPDFAEYALTRFNRTVCEEFFGEIGVDFVFEGDKAYPASLQAASVVDCLRFAAEESGVTVCTETAVTNIQVQGGLYKVIAGNMSFLAKSIIIAAGLLSGGEKYGCTGSVLQIMKKAGFDTVETLPAIVQLKTPTDIVKQLKGIKIDADVSLLKGGKVLRKEYGEVLFCDYGLSGPPILQLSGTAERNGGCEISLDIMSAIDFSALEEELNIRAERLKARRLDEFFTGMLNKRLGQIIIKNADLGLSNSVNTLTRQDIKRITALLKDLRFRITGTTGFANSQVTAGGLDTAQFNCKTMESRDNKGLYAIGEILDIDGDCGGFNLQWAWSSALCAAENIAGANNKC